MKNKASKKQRKPRQNGDIPARANCTISTSSTSLPRVTEECVVRSVAQTTLTVSTVANVYGSFNFQLANANVGSGFFDQYRIEAIRFTLWPQNNAIGLVTNSTTTLVPVYLVIDYDDASNLSSIAAAESYSNCVVVHPGQSCERVFKPRMALAAYSGAFTSYASQADQWIDSANTGVQHYGIKYAIPGITSGQTQYQSWDVHIEYFIRFRKAI